MNITNELININKINTPMVQSDRTDSKLSCCSALRPSLSSLPQLPQRPIIAASLLCHTMSFPESALPVLSQHQRDLHDGQTFLSLKAKTKRNLRSFPVLGKKKLRSLFGQSHPTLHQFWSFFSEDKLN